MNDQKHHQAEQLEQMIQEVKTHAKLSNDERSEHEDHVQTDINILDLPPRREVHKTDDQRFKFRISRAAWRFLWIIIFLLILIGIIIFDVINSKQLFNI